MSDIQNLLHSASPDEPSTDGWTEKVHARRRRNRVVAGVAGGTLALALAVPVGVTVLNQPNHNVANPAVAPTETEAPEPTAPSGPITNAADACAASSELVAKWAELSGGDSPVKLGATQAWLCGDHATVGPAEPLTEGVDELAKAFLDAEEADPNQACTMEYRLAYTLVFQYADGTLAPVMGELHGCRTLTDGATRRSGGEELYNLAVDKWEAARKDAEPSADAATVNCDQQASIIPADLGDLASLSLCVPEADGSWKTLEIPGADEAFVAGVGESVKADATQGDNASLEYGTSALLLVDRFGGVFTLQGLADGSYTFWTDETTNVWTPPKAIADALAAALEA